ncbi:MAG: MBL fold metallo-hydrolase [bacterium]|nr:MBL fold metallo-hydrolase [bacterium]
MKWASSVFLLVLCNAIAWRQVMITARPVTPSFYFFDVGQGDSELLNFGSAQILIDGGPPNGKALKGIERALGLEDRYIDLVILTHPHLDHFGGLIDVMDRYSVGKFITDGTENKTAKAYKSLKQPDMALGEGDTITYGDYKLSVLGPNAAERADPDPNKASVVLLLEGPETRILYAGDMHAENEERLRKEYKLKADVLKVAHHGSRFSSSAAFLKELQPKVAVIGVGKNSYGHPAPAVTLRLEDSNTKTYATLDRGTIKVVPKDGSLKIYTEK